MECCQVLLAHDYVQDNLSPLPTVDTLFCTPNLKLYFHIHLKNSKNEKTKTEKKTRNLKKYIEE